MAKSEFVTCRYKHCTHDNKELPRDEAVQEGTMYFHKDCFAIRKTIQEIEKFYIENFDHDPIMGQLRKTINTLIFTKKNSPQFMLYALRYAKAYNIPVRHPAGLYYLAKDYKIQESWKQYQSNIAASKISQDSFKVGDTLTKVEGYGAQKSQGFGRAIG